MRSKSWALVTVCMVGALACGEAAEDIPAPGTDAGGASSGDANAGGSSSGASSSGSSGELPPDDDPGTPVYPEAHPRILLSNTPLRERLRAALAGDEAAARRFREMVERQQGGGDVYGYAAWHSALLYALTGEQRYGTYAVEHADALITAEEARVAAGDAPEVARDSYLYVGEEVGGLLLVYDWCHDLLDAAQRTRWLAFADQAIWNVWHHEEATWGGVVMPWNGWSVDNPGNNYYYSFLEATMSFALAARGEHQRAATWLEMFRNTKLRDQAVPYFRDQLIGGGSQEGTGYGTAHMRLFKLYALWEYSTTERIARLTQHPRQSMAYLMHATVPTLDFLTPTGDHARESSAALFDYHRDYLQILASLYEGERLAGITRGFLAESSVPEMSQQFMFYSDFLWSGVNPQPEPPTALATAYYGQGSGQIALRSAWAPDATYLSSQCGPYNESHAHRDQGSFVLYRDGWLAEDANLHSRSGLEQAEGAHNLVRVDVDGEVVRQRYGASCQVAALANEEHVAYVLEDVSPLYAESAAVQKMEREILFLKPDTVVVFDRAVTSAGAARVWQLNTPTQPTLTDHRITLTNTSTPFEVLRVAPQSADVQIHPWSSLPSDGEMQGGYRVDVTGSEPVFLHVLSTQNAVATATADHPTGQTGARISFADGGTASVHFSTDGRGGTLRYERGGQVRFDGALPTSVATLPILR